MKKLLPLLLFVILLVSCQNEKTAFVDNNKVVENFDALKQREVFYNKAEDSLKARIELMVAQSGYQDLISQYQNPNSQLSEAKKEEVYNQIMQIQQSIGQQQQFASQELQQRKGKELDSLANLVKTFVQDYGEANGYSYIFGSNAGGNILYGSAQKDISDDIIDELNNKYPAEASEVKESPTDSISEQ